LVSASRFLKFPILNPEKMFRTWTLDPIWRARLCIWPGGSMKGRRAERAGRAAGSVAARCGVSCGICPPSAPDRRPAAASGTPPHPPPAPNGGPAGPTRPAGPPRSAEEPWPALGRGLGGGAIELGADFGRESIFKISHTKSRKKVQNLDPGSDLARTCLHLARQVYEGKRASTEGQ
jgi:hypothetical protein